MDSISNLFLERSSFILIGLTGRTGSGCTTAATILEEESLNPPSLDDLKYQGGAFYEGLDRERYKIAKQYSEANWKNFYSISVSDLISAYILQLSMEDAVSFIYQNKVAEVEKSQIEQVLKAGVFSTSIIRTKFEDLAEKIIDHTKHPNLDLTENELSKFRRFLRAFRRFNNYLKSELNSLQSGLYVSVFQAAGNSIRRVGSVVPSYQEQPFNPESIFSLPESMNRVIKGIRRASSNRKAFVVIDAIRNPFEARYFRERYASFYLVSINAPEEDRARYLQNHRKFTKEQLDSLDERESGSVLDGQDEKEHRLINQNVKRCVEISDIHIFNPRNELDNNNILKAQLAWYFSLMVHPGLITPRSHERVMQFAFSAKTNSGCISRQVGAAITDQDFSVKAIGWNDVAKGQVPCSLRSLDGLNNSFDEIVYSTFERDDAEFRKAALIATDKFKPVTKFLKGRNLAYCFKDLKNGIDKSKNQVHTRSLHAEENAFLQLTKYGGAGIEGGKLFTTASPCELCAKKAYQLGISEIYFIDPYPGIARSHILSIGQRPPKLIQFMGAIGKGYHQLYEPSLSYKDELEIITNEHVDTKRA